MRIWEELCEKIRMHPYSTVKEKERTLSYTAFISEAEKLAEQLDKPCYGILCSSEMNAGIALLACFAAGVTAVPLSPRYGERHCHKIKEKMKMPGMITDETGALKVTSSNLGEYHDPRKRPALVLCTSGTTGSPKGIMLSAKNLLTNVKDIDRYFALSAEDRILIARPLYHGAVLTGEFLLSLWRGVHIVFSSTAFSPTAWLQILQRENITVLCGTPTLLSTFSHFMMRQKHSLRCLAVSGERLLPKQAQAIRAAFPTAEIYSVYGLTEASPRALYLPPDLFDQYPGACGYPLHSVDAAIVDNAGNLLGDDRIGELALRGDNIMQGYFDDPNLTAQKKKNGWLYTGDMALRNEKGIYYILGRKDDLIIRAGMNIYPQEIEQTLEADERVSAALAYPIEEENGGQKIGLKVVGDFEDKKALYAFCQKVLPPWQMPSVFELVESIPQNASGKKIRSYHRADSEWRQA